jgi:type IV pilus assembly protein PilV
MLNIMSAPRPRLQSGSMLLEGLIAVLIFSMGILAIVGMQAAAVKASGDAKYRSDAGLLANELIGRMWVGNRTQATLQTAFSSTITPASGGASYQAWAWVGGDAAHPGTQTSPAAGTVLATLPGAATNLPTVVITPVTTTNPATSRVVVTIFWQAPNETTVHNYTAVAQIGG